MAKILLATAHESVKNGFVEVLAPDGHSFEMCGSGEKVKMALIDGLPDLIIADVDLPGLDAFALVESLQEICGGRPIPPLVMRSNLEGEQKFVRVEGGEAPEEDPRSQAR